jgi:hypothetical protein
MIKFEVTGRQKNFQDPLKQNIQYYIKLAAKHLDQVCTWHGESWRITTPYVFSKVKTNQPHGESLLWYHEVKKALTDKQKERLDRWEEEVLKLGIPPPPRKIKDLLKSLGITSMRQLAGRCGVKADETVCADRKPNDTSRTSLKEKERQKLRNPGNITVREAGMSAVSLGELLSTYRLNGKKHGTSSPGSSTR